MIPDGEISSGTTASDPISVEDYNPSAKRRRRRRRMRIDFDKDDEDDDVKFLYSRKSVYEEGECSRSVVPCTPSTFICGICTDPKPLYEAFRVLGCGHFYCSDCIKKHVASKLQDNFISIGCPVSECHGFLDPLHCGSILPEQVTKRWGDARCEAAMFMVEE